MKRFGTFKPQRTDDLRDDVRHFIGKRMLFTFAGYSREDEPYPGESRWLMAGGYWAPESDIEFED